MNVMVNNEWEFVNDVDDLRKVIEKHLGRELASCLDELDLKWKDEYDNLNYLYENLEDKYRDLDIECDNLQEDIDNLREEIKQLKREKEEIYDNFIDILTDEYVEMFKHQEYYRSLYIKTKMDCDMFSRERYGGMADEVTRIKSIIEKLKKKQ